MRNLEGESDRGLLRAFFDRRLKRAYPVNAHTHNM